MIYGIGVDIVDVSRIRKNFNRYGNRLAERILTDSEFKAFARSSQPANFIAKRFAVKEAAAKALGTGFRNGLYFRHFGLRHDELGRPLLECFGFAEELFVKNNICSSHVSVSDEREHALAFIILEKKD